MSDAERPSRETEAPQLPGPPPPLPDLAAVSASIDRPVLRTRSAAPAGPNAGPARPVAEAPTAAPAAATAAAPVAPAQPPAAPAQPAADLHGPDDRVDAAADPADEWAPRPKRPPRAVVGPWALALAIVALAASFLVGWMLPLALLALVLAVVALRRRVDGARIESRRVSWWALGLAVVGLLYSGGWLLWGAREAGLLG